MPDPVDFPELFIGVAAPIGVDMEAITAALEKTLLDVNYKSILIKLTDEMRRFSVKVENPPTDGLFDTYWWKMDYANAIRDSYALPDAMARICVNAIRKSRARASADDADVPLNRTAYIIRQLKHPEEVRLLRKVYGQQFVLISAYSTERERYKTIRGSIKRTESTKLDDAEIDYRVRRLINRDASETGERAGQQLRDTFHLADVFVDGLNVHEMKRGIERFIYAFFGRTDITPSREEYGMYAAKSASLRSSDLSRQVGAAIFSSDGDLIVQGCNEVPKAMGGTYWDGESPDHRDIRKGHDPNDREKKEIIRDLIERLRMANFLAPEVLKYGNDLQIVAALTKKTGTDSGGDGPLSDSWIMDLTEFGRVVHAEMCALCDAARYGKSVRGGTLFCTTFPCHNCSKHIIAAGVKKVVYMEPYPKSRAMDLHADEIELDSDSESGRVSFLPFLGISPYRYRNIFQKGRRKDGSGQANVWLAGRPQPMVDVTFPSYAAAELWAVAPLIGNISGQPAGDA